MARRRRSSSGGGAIGGILILVVIGMFISVLPYILGIAAIALGIWLLVWIIKKISESAGSNSVRTRVTNVSQQTIAAQNSITRSIPDNSSQTHVEGVNDSLVCKEVRRQILEVFEKKHTYALQIAEYNKQFDKRNKFWNKNKPDNVAARAQLEEAKVTAESRFNSSLYTFNEDTTAAFDRLKQAFKALAGASAKKYDASPDFNGLLTSFHNVGDIKNIRFDVEPICMEYNGNLFYFTPHYIVHFKDNGSFVNVYRTSLLTASITQGSWQEQIPHTTWLHTRKDGQPDLRYSYNPRQTYYTTRTHTVPGMLGIGMLGLSVKYEVDSRIRDEVIAAVRAYAATEVANSFDPIFHILRLLDTCNPNDSNVSSMQNAL